MYITTYNGYWNLHDTEDEAKKYAKHIEATRKVTPKIKKAKYNTSDYETAIRKHSYENQDFIVTDCNAKYIFIST